jgi:hypothetical protein
MMAVICRMALSAKVTGDDYEISPLKFWGMIATYPVSIPLIVILTLRDIENEE